MGPVFTIDEAHCDGSESGRKGQLALSKVRVGGIRLPTSRSRLPARADAALVRIMDIGVSLILLLLLLPLMIVVSTVILITDPGPVYFGHRRLGRNGRSFRCLKFRSMVVDAEQRLKDLIATDPAAREEWLREHKLRDDPRVTRVGNFLRKSSLDELPQLFNVLGGQMSLVGPRPIVQAEVYRYGRYFVEYCRVRPGITGLWQVSGRSDVSYRRRVAMDILYTRSKCFAFDCRILIRTVPSILAQRGSY